jgi:hypothetical protein
MKNSGEILGLLPSPGKLKKVKRLEEEQGEVILDLGKFDLFGVYMKCQVDKMTRHPFKLIAPKKYIFVSFTE